MKTLQYTPVAMIKKLIDKIPIDKKDHVLLGMFVGYPLQILGVTIDILFSTDIFFFIGTTAGILLVGSKEVVYDWYLEKGNPEWWDFIASVIPIAATFAFRMIEQASH